MTFNATKHGRCDCCFYPDANNVVRPLEITRYDAGDGDMRESALCEACTTSFAKEHEALERGHLEQLAADQIASLTAIGDLHSVGGLSLPVAFFKADGTIKTPPWDFGGVQIHLLSNAHEKTMTFVVPVSSLGRLSGKHAHDLVELVEALRGSFMKLVPAGWKVET